MLSAANEGSKMTAVGRFSTRPLYLQVKDTLIQRIVAGAWKPGAAIPNEIETVRELLRVVPDGPDRKFDTLVRAVEQLRALNLDERFVIFTQYRETLEFLKDELGKLYGEEAIVTGTVAAGEVTRLLLETWRRVVEPQAR